MVKDFAPFVSLANFFSGSGFSLDLSTAGLETVTGFEVATGALGLCLLGIIVSGILLMVLSIGVTFKTG